MSNFTDAMLLVDLVDGEESFTVGGKNNVDEFNKWLIEEWPGTEPKFEPTAIIGVFTASINNAADGSDLVEKFRSIPWFEPSSAVLMLRKEGGDSWTAYKAGSVTQL